MKGLRCGLFARVDLVLRFGREIAGVMALVQLFFRPPAGAVDHSPALDGRALADFFRPARQVFIFVRLQELARIVVGGAVQHAVAVPLSSELGRSPPPSVTRLIASFALPPKADLP